MKLRDVLLVLVALVLFSTVVALAVLYRLYVWNAPPSETSQSPTAQHATNESPPSDVRSISRSTGTVVPSLVTPTPSPLPSSTPPPSNTPSPTPTATATATLTPTPLPAARLAGAHEARRNGDYLLALVELQSVLQAPDAEWEAIEARYQIGVIAYLNGEQRRAQEVLTQFIQMHPGDNRAGTAHFYLAEALTATQEYAAANEHYKRYLEQQDTLADLVYSRIARNHLALGSYQAAIDAYERALEHAPDLGQQYDLREQIALVYSAWGRYETAITWLQGITERSENAYRLARIWYLIGEGYRLAGQEDRALDAFAQVVNGDPRPGYAHRALLELVDAGVAVNEYQRGLIDYYAGSYEAAAEALTRHIETTVGHNIDAYYYLALSYFENGSLDLAVQTCQQALDRYETIGPATATPPAHWGDLWLLKGRTLAQWEREDEAVATYTGFAAAYSSHPLAPEARWRAAQLLEEAGRLRHAADAYTVLADLFATSDRAPAARFRAGVARYRSGDADAAMAAWTAVRDEYPAAPESLAARYWLGKVLWSRGQREEARAVLQALAQEQPRDYYGLRATHLIQTQGQAGQWHIAARRSASNGLHLTNDDHAEKQEAADWLRAWASAPAKTDPSIVSADLAGHVLFRRAMELNALSLRAEARDTFEQLRKEVAQDPLQLYQLALLTRDLELYAPSMRATIDLIGLAPEHSVFEMPRLIQRLAFPTYFADLVLSECTTYGLDPLLVFALIRQESVFDAEATSWAGAVGLTQVMPSTGQWIAEMVAWPEYSQEMLQRAYLNVKFGTWFLARILEQAEGDVMVALAGYNGGPARAQSWLEQAGGDPDLFVEVITRDEPQRYVKLIYRHYDVYARLYGGG